MTYNVFKMTTLPILVGLVLATCYSLCVGQNLRSYKTPLSDIKFSNPEGSTATSVGISTKAEAEADSVLNFIESRSGIKLDELSKSSLRESQTKSLFKRKGMDANKFADELAKALVDRIRTAPDAEFDGYIASLHRSKKSIIFHLDATGPRLKGTIVNGDELAKLARSIRSRKYDPNSASYFASGQLRIVVAAQIGLIAKTSPSFMASTHNGKNLPPAQRLLLTYLILSGDAGFREQEGANPLVGPNGKFADIPFAFFLNVDTIKRLTS